jgi:Mn2+/Fe2+ NRAMP family transporter
VVEGATNEPGDAGANRRRRGRVPLLAAVGPGVLLAATGVGAGDLATAGIAGSRLGVAVAWAVVVGAMLKFVLTEGLTRWQLATGTTLLEGASARFGRWFRAAFLCYLLPWSFFTGGALINASGTALNAILPLDAGDPAVGRTVYGVAQSLIGVGLVLAGGFRLFERVMMATVGLMFAGVLVTAVMSGPDPGALAAGLATPRIPEGGLTWTVALLGGVGGTVTVLCYGYWIREHGREDAGTLRACRVDLFVGYTVTALFGVAMLVIASGMGEVSGKGSGLLVSLAGRLGETLGPVGRWAFLLGAWAAIASSLLGVWQAVPYLFADFVRMGRGPAGRGPAGRRPSDPGLPLTRSRAYRVFLVAIAVVPMPMLFIPFASAQKYYAVFGATFIPMLAALLLVMNGRRAWVGAHRNRAWSVIGLASALVLFGWFAWQRLS